MEKQDVNAKKYYTIDLIHIFKSFWQKIWMIVLAAVLAALIGFSISFFLIKPTYSSTVKFYVNNNSVSIGGLTLSDITASQSLVKTYGEILDNRTTLERVKEEADVDYSWKELSEKIVSGASNGTEIMYVTVTTNDPDEAAKIANCIA